MLNTEAGIMYSRSFTPLILICALLLSMISQASMVCGWAKSLQPGSLSELQTPVSDRPCHQVKGREHSHHASINAPLPSVSYEQGSNHDDPGCQGSCESCASCAAACSAVALNSCVATAQSIRQVASSFALVTALPSLTLPLPDRPPIFS